MVIEVASDITATLLREAEMAAPKECCGLLLGDGEQIEQVRPADNIADDPERHFEIDPLALFAAHKAARDGGPQVVGYYHSHPVGHPLPSAVDCEHSSGDGRVWAIVGNGEVTFWRDGDGGFESVPVRFV